MLAIKITITLDIKPHITELIYLYCTLNVQYHNNHQQSWCCPISCLTASDMVLNNQTIKKAICYQTNAHFREIGNPDAAYTGSQTP
jgi:hypothetical protein